MLKKLLIVSYETPPFDSFLVLAKIFGISNRINHKVHKSAIDFNMSV